MQIRLLRETDETVGHVERAARAEAFGAQLVLHLHVDANTAPVCSGLRTYVWPQNARAYAIGSALGQAAPYRLANQNSRPIVIDEDGWPRPWHVMERHKADCILIEHGFSTCPSDFLALLDPVVHRQIMAMYMVGISRALEIYGAGLILALDPGHGGHSCPTDRGCTRSDGPLWEEAAWVLPLAFEIKQAIEALNW